MLEYMIGANLGLLFLGNSGTLLKHVGEKLLMITYTVKPILSDHPLIAIDRWLLIAE